MEREDAATRLMSEKEELLEELKGARSGQDRSAEEVAPPALRLLLAACLVCLDLLPPGFRSSCTAGCFARLCFLTPLPFPLRLDKFYGSLGLFRPWLFGRCGVVLLLCPRKTGCESGGGEDGYCVMRVVTDVCCRACLSVALRSGDWSVSTTEKAVEMLVPGRSAVIPVVANEYPNRPRRCCLPLPKAFGGLVRSGHQVLETISIATSSPPRPPPPLNPPTTMCLNFFTKRFFQILEYNHRKTTRSR